MLFLVSAGLTLVFGALRVVNFAHGSMTMLGAFVGISLIPGDRIRQRDVLDRADPGRTDNRSGRLFMEVLLLPGDLQPAAARPVARHVRIRAIIAGVQREVWGTPTRQVTAPPFVQGGVDILGGAIPKYNFFFIAVAVAVGVASGAALPNRARPDDPGGGLDPTLLGLSGVNVRRLFTGVFVISAFLAGFAGADAARGSASPDLAVDVIVRAFVVVVVGGLGSLSGAFIAAFIIGVAEALGILWVPQARWQSCSPFSSWCSQCGRRVYEEGRPDVAERTQEFSSAPVRSLTDAYHDLVGRLRLAPAAYDAARKPLWVLGLAMIVFAGLIPLFAGDGDHIIAQRALYLGLLALSVNFLVANVGLISFGHAMFWAFGAYLVGIPPEEISPLQDPLIGLAFTPLMGAAAGFVIGLVVFRGRELYFSLLTLGVGQLVWAVAHGWQSLTGGTNGTNGVFAADWINAFLHPDQLYWFIFGVVLLCTGAVYVITKSRWATHCVESARTAVAPSSPASG